eukprot:scpid72686/ scgid32739/ 
MSCGHCRVGRDQLRGNSAAQAASSRPHTIIGCSRLRIASSNKGFFIPTQQSMSDNITKPPCTLSAKADITRGSESPSKGFYIPTPRSISDNATKMPRTLSAKADIMRGSEAA